MRIALLAALAVAGCATPPPLIVEGTAHSVTVNWANNPRGSSGALEAAEAHCAKYGKHAQAVGNSEGFDVAYNCVKS